MMIEKQAVQLSARTAVAAVVSLLAARAFGLPEAYWAPVTTLIVTQSTLGAAVTISVRRFAGTALGAAVGALMATRFGPSVAAFGAGIFLLGIICELLGLVHHRVPEYLDRSAYRFGSITLAIVMLVISHEPAWVIALHRFIEVSIGIVVGLLLTIMWPEPNREIT
jgi:uncharacterized membrane protein YccC